LIKGAKDIMGKFSKKTIYHTIFNL